MRLITLISSIIVVSGCASTYRVPVEEAPPAWRDHGDPIGLAVIQGTTQAFSGEMKKGDVLLQFDVENERVATITNDIEWQGAFGGDQKIAAGSPAYARQFSLQRTTTYNYAPIGPSTNLNAHNNPIEWCVPRQSDAVCIFWEGPETARYISTSLGIPQNARPSSPSGTEGPMPIIEEQDRVEFANKMQVRSSITRMNERELRISSRIYAGDDWNSFGRSVQRLKWAEGAEHEVNVYGARYKISANFEADKDVKSVNVELIHAPEDVKLISMQNAMEVLNALIALEKAKAAQAASEADDASGAEDSDEVESPDGL